MSSTLKAITLPVLCIVKVVKTHLPAAPTWSVFRAPEQVCRLLLLLPSQPRPCRCRWHRTCNQRCIPALLQRVSCTCRRMVSTWGSKVLPMNLSQSSFADRRDACPTRLCPASANTPDLEIHLIHPLEAKDFSDFRRRGGFYP